MKFLADENVARLVVEKLREHGHDVLSISEYALGITDDEVLKIAREQDRIILTHDRDFGNVLRLNVDEYAGILLLRLRDQSPDHVLDRLVSFIANNPAETLRGSLIIVGSMGNRFYRRSSKS